MSVKWEEDEGPSDSVERSVFWFAPQVAALIGAGSEAESSVGVRAQMLRPCSAFFPRGIGRELDWRWDSQDANQGPDEMQDIQGDGLTHYAATPAPRAELLMET